MTISMDLLLDTFAKMNDVEIHHTGSQSMMNQATWVRLEGQADLGNWGLCNFCYFLIILYSNFV